MTSSTPPADSDQGVGLGTLLIVVAALGLAFWFSRGRKSENTAQPEGAQAPTSEMPAISQQTANAVINMGSNIKKAEAAAKLQTQSQQKTDAAVMEAVEAQ